MGDPFFVPELLRLCDDILVVLGSVVVAVGEDRGQEVGALFCNTGSLGAVENGLAHLEVIFDLVVFLLHLEGSVLNFYHRINLY